MGVLLHLDTSHLNYFHLLMEMRTPQFYFSFNCSLVITLIGITISIPLLWSLTLQALPWWTTSPELSMEASVDSKKSVFAWKGGVTLPTVRPKASSYHVIYPWDVLKAMGPRPAEILGKVLLKQTAEMTRLTSVMSMMVYNEIPMVIRACSVGKGRLTSSVHEEWYHSHKVSKPK